MINEDKTNINRQLSDIREELYRLANEIDNIADDISGSNKGIGQTYCAAQLKTISKKYRDIKNKLNY